VEKKKKEKLMGLEGKGRVRATLRAMATVIA
jgi:hypothetical protein